MSDPITSGDEFPENIIEVMAVFFRAIEGVSGVELRSLNHLDANGTVGIDVAEWLPDTESYEVGGFGPSCVYYLIRVEHVVKHEDAALGRREHRRVGKIIQTMLYEDNPLQVSLRSLTRPAQGRRDRILKWTVLGQQFGANEIEGKFVSLSATDLSFTVESLQGA